MDDEKVLKDALKTWQEELKEVDAHIKYQVVTLEQEIEVLRAKLFVLDSVAKKIGAPGAERFHQEYGSYGIRAEIDEKEGHLEQLKILHRMRSNSTRLIIETIKDS